MRSINKQIYLIAALGENQGGSEGRESVHRVGLKRALSFLCFFILECYFRSIRKDACLGLTCRLVLLLENCEPQTANFVFQCTYAHKEWRAKRIIGVIFFP